MFRDFLLEDRQEGGETRQEEIAMSGDNSEDGMSRSHRRDNVESKELDGIKDNSKDCSHKNMEMWPQSHGLEWYNGQNNTPNTEVSLLTLLLRRTQLPLAKSRLNLISE